MKLCLELCRVNDIIVYGTTFAVNRRRLLCNKHATNCHGLKLKEIQCLFLQRVDRLELEWTLK